MARLNPFVDYLRRNPDFPLSRGLRLTINAWRSIGAEPQGPQLKLVPIDRLLCGGEQGLSAAQYARHTKNLLRGSTPVTQSPHVRFLENYLIQGDAIFSPPLLRNTDYFNHAVECIDSVGEFLGCTNEADLESLARQFVNLFEGTPLSNDYADNNHLRAPGSLVYVRPIKHSDCYEVLDGMHQLAIAHARGERQYKVYAVPPAVLTPLQELLMDSAFCHGNRELYQPVSSPELELGWSTIRRCTDRFEMMKSFLTEQSLLPPNASTSLDVAFSYGWFVKAFEELGFDARGGGEIDWASREVGLRVYGLKEEQLVRSELVRFLRADSQRYDVVTCLSILHHFLIGLPYRAPVSAEEMIKLVDEKTKHVLFLDSGQSHEPWFHNNLIGWDEDRIEEWLRANTSFTRVYRLGKDLDDAPPFEGCYGRTLFACMR